LYGIAEANADNRRPCRISRPQGDLSYKAITEQGILFFIFIKISNHVNIYLKSITFHYKKGYMAAPLTASHSEPKPVQQVICRLGTKICLYLGRRYERAYEQDKYMLARCPRPQPLRDPASSQLTQPCSAHVVNLLNQGSSEESILTALIALCTTALFSYIALMYAVRNFSYLIKD
jgi:hypothetical protein